MQFPLVKAAIQLLVYKPAKIKDKNIGGRLIRELKIFVKKTVGLSIILKNDRVSIEYEEAQKKTASRDFLNSENQTLI